jgi:uncharacterized phage protein (TIGR01671 family)
VESKEIMNREIKFRGKMVDNGEWAYGYFTVIKGTYYISEDVPDGVYFDHSVIPETVGQFTGLHDKNGKEIYEGDIVQTDDYSKGAFFGINQPVKHIVIEYEELSTGMGFRILHKDSAQVIGNIYENPELIK